MAVDLAFAEHGAGPPVLILHGLFGAGTNWTTVAQRLSSRFRVFTLDMRNHGASPWTEPMDYPAMAADLAAFIAARGLGTASLVGHSMGGKAAMLLALEKPQLVERLVVVDIAPVAHPPLHGVEVEAMRALDLRGVERRGAVDAVLRPRIPDDAVRHFLLQNLVTAPGGLKWRLNLDAIAAAMTTLSGFPAPPGGKPHRGPTLLVRGERSDYAADPALPPFRALFPALEVATIAGAGHWVHAERLDDFIAAVNPFLARS